MRPKRAGGRRRLERAYPELVVSGAKASLNQRSEPGRLAECRKAVFARSQALIDIKSGVGDSIYLPGSRRTVALIIAVQ